MYNWKGSTSTKKGGGQNTHKGWRGRNIENESGMYIENTPSVFSGWRKSHTHKQASVKPSCTKSRNSKATKDMIT